MKVEVIKFCMAMYGNKYHNGYYGIIKINDKHIRRFDLCKENNYIIEGKKYHLEGSNMNDLSLGKYVYEVFLNSEYSCDMVYDLRDKYTKWFDTKKDAIAYARSIKKELKELFKNYNVKDNIITLDVQEYYTDTEMFDEDFCGIVYSLNIVNKY